jgi:hypothetical protein
MGLFPGVRSWRSMAPGFLKIGPSCLGESVRIDKFDIFVAIDTTVWISQSYHVALPINCSVTRDQSPNNTFLPHFEPTGTIRSRIRIPRGGNEPGTATMRFAGLFFCAPLEIAVRQAL